MKHFRIQIDDQDSRARAMCEVMRRRRIVCLRGNQFIVPKPALALLDECAVDYRLIGEDDPETAVRAVRDSLAASR